jgi:hypothetical protein
VPSIRRVAGSGFASSQYACAPPLPPLIRSALACVVDVALEVVWVSGATLIFSVSST